MPFGKEAKDSTEIVPALLLGTANGAHVFAIADCAGGWMRSSPDAQDAYVRAINQQHAGKVKPLVRYIKAWKYLGRVPLSSFYLEMAVTRYSSGESSIDYSTHVLAVLTALDRIGLAAIDDPTGIGGPIQPCQTQKQLNEAKFKLKVAVKRATMARDAQTRGRVPQAFYYWNLLFASKFPTYYRS